MAQEIEPREYEDVPQDDLAGMLEEEELLETQEEEVEEHAIPKALLKIIKSECILDDLSEADVLDIQQRVTDGCDMDSKSMEDYVDKYEKVIKLAAMDDNTGDKTFPFVGASKVMLPQLAKAAIDFNSRTVPDLVNRADIANVKVWTSKPDPIKDAIAERRALAINWQLKRGIDGWARRQDRALLLLPVGGMYFKKKWQAEGKIQDCLITADRMIYDHDADSFSEAPRKSHWFMIDQNDFESAVRREYYKDIDAHYKDQKPGKDKQPKIDKPIKLIESHCTLDLDHDGYCEPYIVTFCDCCDTVVKVERRFSKRDVFVDDGKVVSIKGEEFFTQHGFIPDLQKPAVYVGWGQMLFDIFESLNTMMRQVIDAGTLANTAMNSGFISDNIKTPGRTKSQRVELILGQLTKVTAGGGQSLKDMIWTPQFAGASQGFYQTLQDLKNEVDQYVTASQTMDVSAGEAASLWLGRLQQALKVPNAIASRVYSSMTDEFLRIDDLMRRYMSDEEYKAIINWQPDVPPEIEQQYQMALQQWEQMGGAMMGIPEPQDPVAVANSMVIKDEDFAEDLGVFTTADPTLGSDQERIARAEVVATRAAEVPGYNRYEAEKQYLQRMGVNNIDKVLPPPSNEPDPMAELQMKWTAADIERMMADSAKKMAEIEAKGIDMQLKYEKQQAELDKILSETMKNLHEIDASEAQIAMKTLDMARSDVEMELEAQRNMTDRKAYKVMDHPEHGEVTEADIQQTMADNGMTRDEVIAALQAQQNVTGQ
jgi:hypothetical protein